MRRLAFLALPTLCACAGPSAPDLPMIEVSSSSFFGSSSTRIFTDGTTISDNAAPGHSPVHSVQHGSPEVYARAAAVLAREGRTVKAALRPPAQQCLDYGTDLVRAVPPVAGFDQAMSACPDQALSRLMDHVRASVAPR